MGGDDRDQERRGGLRAPIRLKVEYERLNVFFADFTRNISRGGTFIRTDKPLPIGTEFEFRLVVPELPHPIKLRGTVQWIVPPEGATAEQEAGMGIGFRHETEEDRLRIEKIVRGLMDAHLGEQITRKLLDDD